MSDTEYWPHSEYGIQTEKNLADYWASLYGFEAGEDSDPPFLVTVGLSHSGNGVEKIRSGQIDIGNSSAPVTAEKPNWSQDVFDKFVDHVISVDGQRSSCR